MNKQKKYQMFIFLFLCAILLLRICWQRYTSPPIVANPLEYKEKTASKRLLQGDKINLNRANRHDLIALPGIGPKRAQGILALRKQLGHFSDLAQLRDLPGISDGVLDQIRPYVVLGSSAEQSAQSKVK